MDLQHVEGGDSRAGRQVAIRCDVQNKDREEMLDEVRRL